MQARIRKTISGFGILQVFFLIVIFGIVALIIQTMINSYQSNIKRQQLTNSQNLIEQMLNGSLINSVAALSYSISKCGTPADITAFPQNPIFCLCMKEKKCLASPPATNTTPDGFPFMLYRSDPSIPPGNALAGGMVSFCNPSFLTGAPAVSQTCLGKATRAQVLDSKQCPEAIGTGALTCMLTSAPATGIPADYSTHRGDLHNGAIQFVDSAGLTAEQNTKDLFTGINSGSFTPNFSTSDSMILLPQNMARYSVRGERCTSAQYSNASDLMKNCPFSVDVRFKVDCSGAKKCDYTKILQNKIHICYTIHHDQSAGGPALAPLTNVKSNGTCDTLQSIMERAAGNYTPPGSTSSSSLSPISASSSLGLSSSHSHNPLSWESSDSASSGDLYPSSGSSSSTLGIPFSSSLNSDSSSSSSQPHIIDWDHFKRYRLPFDLPGYTGLPSGNVLSIFYNRNNGRIYVGTDHGLSISTNNGSTFVTRTRVDGLMSDYVSEIHAIGSDVYLVAGSFYTCKDLCTTFTKIPNVYVSEVDSSGSWVYAIGNSFYKSSTSNMSFTLTYSGNTGLTRIAANGSMVYATASRNWLNQQPGGLLISSDYGNTFPLKWSNDKFSSDAASNSTFGVATDGADNLYVSTSAPTSKLWVSLDKGGNFLGYSLPSSVDFGSSAKDVCVSGSSVFIGTSQGLAVSSLNGQNMRQAWRGYLSGSMSYPPINRLQCTGYGNAYAATDQGYLQVNDTGWFTQKTPFELGSTALGSISHVHVSGQMIFVSTQDIGILVSSDGGANFRKPYQVPFKWVSSSGSNIYGATSYGISISRNNGSSFSYARADGTPANMVYADGSNVYLASSLNITVSRDYGASFTEKIPPIDNKKYDSYSKVHASGSMVYAALRSNLWISNNYGENFSKIDSFTHGNISALFSTGSQLYIGANNVLYISNDHGVQFTTRTTQDGFGDINIYQIYASGQMVYVMGINTLSISTDGGNTFKKKSAYDLIPSGSYVSGWFTTFAVDGTSLYLGTWGSHASYGNGPMKVVPGTLYRLDAQP